MIKKYISIATGLVSVLSLSYSQIAMIFNLPYALEVISVAGVIVFTTSAGLAVLSGKSIADAVAEGKAEEKAFEDSVPDFKGGSSEDLTAHSASQVGTDGFVPVYAPSDGEEK